jgi:hypothetical protein
VPHTELERVGNPLDMTVTLAATAGLAAATAPCSAGIPGLSSRVGSRYGLGGSLAAVEHLPQALAMTVA